ncbi:DUF5684 domain-containing protein [Umezawaea sp. NPDC059074]|uniref:DUF5684 domain-containing protein n=1 Tax=Umezawaea sp. NPDC059074 TaxID=3346716 RepID=UPI0036B3697D
MNEQLAQVDPRITLISLGVALFVAVLKIAATWRIFRKAGKRRWAALVPIYSGYTLLKLVGRSGWWLLLYLVPFVNIVVSLIVQLNLAKSFRRSAAFGFFGLWIFDVIGYLVLGFGRSTYWGPAVGQWHQAAQYPAYQPAYVHSGPPAYRR